ncbi:gp436 family protein [Desulfocurvibacter africanus]|uniref:Mu-like prophage protein gp36 n=1 Tax=Desulfocurvibacter africanus subsp. africanus str. Walvis Bay TaxID=690850 RepID=F3YW15_DESAF|nr:DUF1320 domain-containing protein [Desulfocurvibacter africanus]EGJ49045.1 protein of unknown function DUF1320 [Desulfocurvibacter africanus subsp. africanus str. Walvis Bay]
MSYASQQDIVDRHGEEELLLLADRDGDGVVDPDVILQAQADADAEIDAYLAARYQLPLPTVPTVLKRLAVDILVYRLASDAGTGTDERRLRYEDAVALLRRISKGEVSLGLTEAPTSTGGGVHMTSGPRRFGRGGGLL